MNIGNHIKRLRLENALTQEQLACKLYVSRQAIAKWEKGESLPDQGHMIELAKLFNLTLDELVMGKKGLKQEISLSIIYKLLALVSLVIVLSIGLTIILDQDLGGLVLVPGMILLIVFPVVLMISYAVKSNDFSMLAGYKFDENTNHDELKRMLITMMVAWLSISLSMVLLHGLRYITTVPSWYNLMILGLFLGLFLTFTIVIQFKYKSKLKNQKRL